MENGEADLYPFMAGSQQIRRLQEAEHLGVTTDGYAAVGPINWLAFNTASEKLSDKRVRQAIAYAVPVFWTGIMLIIFFASWLPVFPVEGMQSVRLRDADFLLRIVDVAHHLVLPAFTLAMIYLAQYSRLSRASMLEVLGSDYIRTARAKGASERSVLFRHALRNAALPILTVAGLQFGNLISGALLVETVFNWPGMGRLAFDSVLRRDYPTILGVLFFASLLVVIVNILTDFSYRLADPRLRERQ